MIAKDVITSQITPLLPDESCLDRISTVVSGDIVLPIVDSDGHYAGMRKIAVTPHDDCPETYPERPVKSSAPLSLVLEKMAAGSPVVPVVDDFSGTYTGAIDRSSALAAVSRLFPQLNEYTELTITCPPSQYSASAIAHAVEDADAHLLNLNVTAGTEPDLLTTVMLRVNHSRGESVARSLQRYGYDTVEMTGDPGVFHSDMAERVNALLHYLEI